MLVLHDDVLVDEDACLAEVQSLVAAVDMASAGADRLEALAAINRNTKILCRRDIFLEVDGTLEGAHLLHV